MKNNCNTKNITESDIIIVGGGPAGVCAAIAAARAGADTILIESGNCLGGMWTAGSLGWILDGENKKNNTIIIEIINCLKNMGAYRDSAFDIEVMKFLLENMCLEAKVKLRYYTTLTDVVVNNNVIDHIVTSSKSGYELWRASVYIDCTGDGDLGYLAGNPYEVGHPENGKCQPMSFLALLTGLKYEEVAIYAENGGSWNQVADRFSALLTEGNYQPSYQGVALFHLFDDVFFLMANHQYGKSGVCGDDLTQATICARREIIQQINILKKRGGIWENIKLVNTADKIGVRESRRLQGKYKITLDDLINGARHDDGIVEVSFGVDVHELENDGNFKIISPPAVTKPYEVPLRSLISSNIENLLFAGRCISGDFYAHSSYRVTGNVTVFGQAAGVLAATACLMNKSINDEVCSRKTVEVLRPKVNDSVSSVI